ncbi:MAG: N-carbamoylputrescine amidase [Myxococcales bacterium]|nr:N-carbamoylputrescine amidase [Myxococcales bacterium]
MTEKLVVSVIQCPLNSDRSTNVDRVFSALHKAVEMGAQVILPPELFESVYFPQTEEQRFFSWAQSASDNKTLTRIQEFAAKYQVVIPYSFFEVAGPTYYNSLAMVDASGDLLGIYRKSHIPDGPGYEEKFYFRPGDTGFRVWRTKYGTIGVGVCWDQWFPECARAMALLGAEILLYPTAIGSEPVSGEDTFDPWQRAMVGHAVSNSIPVAAANRIGPEGGHVFYGGSFIANERGDKVVELGREDEGVVTAEFDLSKLRIRRAEWGFFRDRRPDLYRILQTADGSVVI